MTFSVTTLKRKTLYKFFLIMTLMSMHNNTTVVLLAVALLNVMAPFKMN
jgi:hypothetical protein